MLRRYAWAVLAYNLAVILWGAFVRTSGSGAGCGSHWPLCNGEVIPSTESIATVIELTHRVTSGLALLLVIGLVIAAFRSREKGHPVRTAAVLSLIFILLEAAVGAGIVLLEYVADDTRTARAYWMAGHLTNTFLLIAALTLTAWWADATSKPVQWSRLSRISWWLRAALIGTLLVGVTGAIAALGDTLFPSTDLVSGIARDFDPNSHILTRLRVAHPFVAIAVGLLTVIAAVQARAKIANPIAKRVALFVGCLFVAQLLGGVLNLLLLAPTWMQLTHLLMADLVWIGLVALTATAATEEAV